MALLWHPEEEVPIVAGNLKGPSLMLRIFISYLAVLFIGSGFIVFNNLVLHGKAFSELLVFNIPFLMGSDVIFALLLQLVTYWRLAPVLRYFHRRDSYVRRADVFRRMLRFPMELFGGMMLLSVGFIVLFHISDILFHNGSNPTPENWASLAGSILSELTLSMILGLLLFTVTRKLLRPYFLLLDVEGLEDGRGTSVFSTVAVTFTVCFVISYSAAYRYMDSRMESSFSPAGFMLFAGVYSAFAIMIFTLTILDVRRELRLLIDGLHELGWVSRIGIGLQRSMAVITDDETGKLTMAFNWLQWRIERAYNDVERQAKLAYEVQQRLLPKHFPTVPGLEISAFCGQCHEVGGDFYDVISLGEKRLAIAIGDVSGKGMPAALLMTAVMTGLRMEAGKGGSAGDMLSRLNSHVFNMTKGNMYVTIGLALLELSLDDCAVLDYASAGHMAPYMQREGQLTEVPCSSLPLGIDPDEIYKGEARKLAEGDTWVLYTDGMIESADATGAMLGFEGWEQKLGSIHGGEPLPSTPEELAERFELTDEVQQQDDRTVVLIRWNGTIVV
jgi:phosphoserine phosphatase RsbU/P